jgi:hypothetical protein
MQAIVLMAFSVVCHALLCKITNNNKPTLPRVMIMTDSVRTANATTPSRRARLQPRVLEPRVLLDAAAVETVPWR